MINKKTIIRIASIACFTACIGDFWVTFVLGGYKPGYSQLRNTMSLLGVTTSPVSGIISLWWIILGLLIILFAFGFGKAFGYNKRPVKIATWLMIIYGLGEGLGSGLFKDDLVNNSATLSSNIHEILGGMGTAAILVLPFAMIKIIRRTSNPGFHTLSVIVFLLGLVFLAMFLFRLIPYESNDLLLYKGLWQRLFILDYYIYLIVIAVIMIKKQQMNNIIEL
jgi:hypothetical protein